MATTLIKSALRRSGFHFHHSIKSTGHRFPSFASSLNHRSYSCAPNSPMRFIQFVRNCEPDVQRLGIVCADGEKMVDMTSHCSSCTDVISLIKAGPSVLERLQCKVKDLTWTPVDDTIKLLSPITKPDKIICIGLNYVGHCKEQNLEPPKEPMFFSKLNNTLVGPSGDVIAHKCTEEIDWEVELAVIIGKEARKVEQCNAMDYVFGYTIAQDISARDWQKKRNGGQFLIGKSMDTFCPLGPAVVHKCLVPDPHELVISCNINGVNKQCGNTNELVYRIDQIIHLLSQSITLLPGDIILTGTPGGVGMHRKPAEFLKPGDLIESEIQGLGKLANRVVADC